MSYDDDLLATGPVRAYRLDGDLTDSSATGAHLTYSTDGWGVAPEWVEDSTWGTVMSGGSYSGDGPIVLVPDGPPVDIDPNEPFSGLYWVKAGPEGVSVLMFPDTMIRYTAFAWMDPEVWYATVETYFAYAYASAGVVGDPFEQWVCGIYTWDGTTVRLYINGDLVASATAGGPASPVMPFTAEVYGQMTRVALWDRVLSPSEIALLSQPPSAPTAAYPPHVWDDFDRSDGPIGIATPSGFWWNQVSGSWVVDDGRGRLDSLPGSGDALAVLSPVSPGTPAVWGVAATVDTTYEGLDWSFAMACRAQDDGTGLYLYVGGGGVLALLERNGGPSGSFVEMASTVVDVSPGDHRAQLWLDPASDVMSVRLVWDDVIVVAETVSSWYLAGDRIALWAQAGSTASVQVPFDDLTVFVPGIEVPFAPAPTTFSGGVEAPVVDPPGLIRVPFLRAPSFAGGVAAPPSPHDLRPLYVPFLAAPTLARRGVRLLYNDTPDPPPVSPPGYQLGRPPAEFTIDGDPYATVASCKPQANGGGSGSYTTLPPGPGLGDDVRYLSGRSPVFFGIADQVQETIAAQNEEAGQLVSVTTPGALQLEWADTVVYPDFGAYEPIRTGQPAQDDRVWGWPMNGLNDPQLTWTTTRGGDNGRYGTPREIFPIPDNWPDHGAVWMLPTDPDQKVQAAGWRFMRMPFGTFPGEYSLFVCAYDFARVYVDGALVMTIDTPGVTKRVELDFDWDCHLIAIELYCQGGGLGGVLVSLLQKHPEGFGGTDCYSRGGWKALDRPTTSMRATVGAVLLRLIDEAGARGAPAGRWGASFTKDQDSNGRSWPRGDNAPLIVTKVGSTYWDVLQQFEEGLIDFYGDPGGRTLHAFVKDTAHGSGAIPWTHTIDADTIQTRQAGH